MKNILLSFLLLLSGGVFAQSSTDLYERLKKLNVTGTVLYVAAHPDDENTRLITWLSKEKQFRTAYISLTRGDGGQNLIGSELGVELGLIRTRELMAARTIDGGEQFFTRAYDFGFSKRPEETLQIWEKEKVLEDFVQVIRTLKPDIIICRFPPDSRAGHGHHSSSAILAREAFDAAADATRFPEQAKEHGTWKVKRLYWNTFNFGSNNTTNEQQRKVDVGGFNALSGKSNGELSAESRSQHKSQGFGVPSQRGTLMEYFEPIAGDTSVADPFVQLNNYWGSTENGKAISAAISAAAEKYNFLHPEASIQDLLRIRKMVNQLNPDPIRDQKLKELESVILDCAGLWTAAYSWSDQYAVKDTLHVGLQAVLRNYKDAKIILHTNAFLDSSLEFSLLQQKPLTQKLELKGSLSDTQPYWLQKDHQPGVFQMEDRNQTAKPWNDPPVLLQASLVLFDERIPFSIPVRYKETDPVKGELIHPLCISPKLTGTLSEQVSVFNSVQPRSYQLNLTYWGTTPETLMVGAATAGPEDWKIHFRDTAIYFKGKNDKHVLSFTAEPRSQSAARGTIRFGYTGSDGLKSELKGRRKISYGHIPTITWFPALKTELQYVPVKAGCKNILYIKGAGDDVAPVLRQIGYRVDEVSAREIREKKLEDYDAILTGIRAYNTDDDLPEVYDRIMKFVAQGGTFLVQYNTNSNLHPARYMSPFPYAISRNRVTEEKAEVRFTDPSHPLLNRPNKISAGDFDGWVQERGLYFATKIDSAFANLLLMNDHGEKPQEGSLITCSYGKGRYIYTGLAFFRQLPMGVPGAIRLFANLIGEYDHTKAQQEKKTK
ncbi:MAG: PIG-L family deacetylase [Bacteroidia bacterium]|nr:PIG-L family deacetylase [Bacteroidia bacterium]